MAYYSLLYLLGGFVWWERFFEGYYGKLKIKDVLCMIIFLPQSVMIGTYRIIKFILNKEINLR